MNLRRCVIQVFDRDSEGIISHMLVHLDEAQISLDVPSNGIHEGGLASPRFSMKQITTMVGDAMLGIESACLILQKPLQVIQYRSLHTSALREKKLTT